MRHVVVVGAGLAGLLASARLRDRGHRVTLVSFGVGGLPLSHGCLDVLGYAPERVDDPFAALPEFCSGHPRHPYAVLGADAVETGVGFAGEFFAGHLAGRGTNWLLPTAVGGLRPTFLAHRTMTGAQIVLGPARGTAVSGGETTTQVPARASVLVAGPTQLKDFQPTLIAANLERTAGVCATAVALHVEARPGEVDSSALTYARALDDPETARRFAAALAGHASGHDLVLLPAMLGLHRPTVAAQVSQQVALPVAEIAMVPPSVPGLRMNEHALAELKRREVRVILGARVTALDSDGARVTGVTVRTTGHDTRLACDALIYAPGGFESGALSLNSYGTVAESHLGLPVRVPAGDLINGERRAAQPLFEAGVVVDACARVLSDGATPLFPNLFAAGGILAGAQRWRELSGEGIAAASAVRAADGIEELA